MSNVEIIRDVISDPYHLTGTTLNGRYLLESVAGAGGMSLVYRGREIATDKVIAIKVLRPDLLLRQSQANVFLRLFQQEARAAQRLSHFNILSVFDSGFDGGVAFIVMEWLEGLTLGQELENTGKFSLRRTLVILEQVCKALHEAHRKKIVHLDLKPNNIFLLRSDAGKDVVKVIDFGLARIMQSTVGTTLSRYVGTPFYSAPEVFNNKASRLSDIYSLGVTTFEMLTGLRPFSQSQIHAVIYQHLEQAAPSVRSSVPEVPVLVDELIQRAMNKSPSTRPNTALEFYEEFSRAIKRTTVFTGQPGRPTTFFPDNPSTPSRLTRTRDWLSIFMLRPELSIMSLARFLEPPLLVILLLAGIIILYPFPQLWGLRITRFHGWLVCALVIFFLSFEKPLVSIWRGLFRRGLLTLWVLSWGIILFPSESFILQPIIATPLRKHGLIIGLVSLAALSLTHREIRRNPQTMSLEEYNPLPLRLLALLLTAIALMIATTMKV
jgi:serine/threonine protein kinase